MLIKFKGLKAFISIVFVLIVNGSCFAESDLIGNNLNITSGLPSNNIYYTFSDSKGYLWFGTDYGVSRYNGLTFTNFGIEQGLPNNDVFIIDEDKSDRIWFGTFDPKLSYLENDSIHLYKFNDSILKYFPEKNVIKGFHFSEDGSIYVASIGHSLIKIDAVGQVTRLGKVKVNAFDFGNKILTGQGRAANFNLPVEKYRNKNSGIHLFNGESYKGFFNLTNAEAYRKINQDPPFSIKTKSGAILIVKGGRFISIQNDSIYITQKKLSLISIFQDDQEFIWVGTRRKGVYVFKDQSLNDTLCHLLDGYSVTNIARDFQGGYWISTLEAGAFKYPSHPLRYQLYDLPRAHIKRILKGPQNLLFVLYNNGALFELNGNSSRQIAFYNEKTKFDFSYINYDKSSNTIVVKNADFKIPSNLDYTLENAAAYPSIPIKSRSFAHVKTSSGVNYQFYRKGIFKLDNGFDFIPKSDQFEFNKILDVHEHQDTIWLGCDNGMYYMANETFFRFENEYITSNRVSTIDVSDEIKAIGVYQKGLLLYKGGISTLLTKGNGLFDLSINDLLLDKEMIWIATNSGLFYINWKKEIHEIKKVSSQQGLSSVEIYTLESNNNMLFLGTKHGFVTFEKSQIENPILLPKLHATIISVNNQNPRNFNLKKLKYNQNNIDVFLEAITFSDNEHLKYKWKIIELDEEWNHSDHPYLSFKKLRPGAYTVSAMCSSLPSLWSEPYVFSFIIASPFWMQWWFILVGIIVVFTSVVGLFRYRINRTKLVAKKELKRLQDRTDLEMKALRAQMNPHFIFNAMNTILSMIKQKKNADAESYLIKLSGMLRSITEKSPHAMITLNEELQITEQYVSIENIRFGNDIDFTLNIDPDINKEKLKVPGLLLQPFVENAIVHGLRTKEGEKKIKISIKRHETTIIYSIEDNGIGREKAKNIADNKRHKKRSVGISNSTQRLDLINSISNKNKVSMVIEDLKDKSGRALGTKILIQINVEY